VVLEAAAALPEAEKLEHAKFTVGGTQYEHWTLAGKWSRSVVTGRDGKTAEFQGGPICSLLGLRHGANTCSSTGVALRSALTSGEARFVSERVLGTRRVKEISFTAKSTGLSGVYLVDSDTLLPVRLTTRMPHSTPEQPENVRTVVAEYSLLEYLEPTPSNLLLLGPPPS
jgi:hypothetical protein